jgi:hypothetical protein
LFRVSGLQIPLSARGRYEKTASWCYWNRGIALHHARIAKLNEQAELSAAVNVEKDPALAAVELVDACMLSGVKKKTVDLPLDREDYDCPFMALSSGASRILRVR